MNRRPFIAAVSGAATSTIAGCAELESVLTSATENEFVDAHTWTPGGELELELQPDHDTDGFAILHEHHSSSSDNSIVAGETPEFSGPIVLPLVELIVDEGLTYPTPTFQAKFYNGSFQPWDEPFTINLYREELGAYEFEVPEELRPAGSFSDR